MRGDLLDNEGMFSYLTPAQRAPKDHAIRPLSGGVAQRRDLTAGQAERRKKGKDAEKNKDDPGTAKDGKGDKAKDDAKAKDATRNDKIGPVRIVILPSKAGVPLDAEAEQLTADAIAGREPQLEKAIEIVMKQLEASPQTPKRPPYPVRVRR